MNLPERFEASRGAVRLYESRSRRISAKTVRSFQLRLILIVTESQQLAGSFFRIAYLLPPIDPKTGFTAYGSIDPSAARNERKYRSFHSRANRGRRT
jgi:hypothetical protein